VQDGGRFGGLAFGFSPNGALDAPALVAANLLAGNPPDFPALEMTMRGIEATFTCDAIFSLTGADMGATLNRIPLRTYRAHAAKKVQTLRVGAAVRGLRGYLAFSGGLCLEPVLGSFSTNLKCALGGFLGRALRRGDVLPLHRVCAGDLSQRVLPCPAHLDARHPVRTVYRVRAVRGPQAFAFPEDALRSFFTQQYTLTPASDRMGAKLCGEALTALRGMDILSDGLAPGSVQIAANGQPIVMLSDRQTTGGYAKIATVVTADLPLLAQCKPGNGVLFEEVSVEEAQKIYKQQQRQQKQLAYRFLSIM
jgi:biotin-dependent carboxylase-like uncharacterized protein